MQFAEKDIKCNNGYCLIQKELHQFKCHIICRACWQPLSWVEQNLQDILTEWLTQFVKDLKQKHMSTTPTINEQWQMYTLDKQFTHL
jgi:hypothetical protein